MKLRSKAALFALVAGIWPYLRNIVCTHNPVFPFLSPALSPALVMAYAVKALASNTGGSSIPGQRNCLFVLGAFGAIGLVLVIMGVFSVMAYTVSLRTHEIGIRMALGAVERDVLRMVLKSGLVLVTAGALAGVNMSLALTRLMASQI